MKAQKANKIISIPEHQKDAYLQEGWMILDDNESIIVKPLTGEAELKSQIEALRFINADKDNEIRHLQEEVASLNRRLNAALAQEPAKKEKESKKSDK